MLNPSGGQTRTPFHIGNAPGAALSRVQRTCADLPPNQADSRCRPNAATLSAVHKKVQGVRRSRSGTEALARTEFFRQRESRSVVARGETAFLRQRRRRRNHFIEIQSAICKDRVPVHATPPRRALR